MAKVFRTIIWPRRKQLLIGLVLIVISRLAGLVLPGASKYLVDDVIPSSDFELLKWLIIAVVLAVIVQSVTSFALTQILSVEAQNLISKLRAQVQAHIIRLPIRFFDSAKTGELVSRVMTDVEGVRNLVGTGLAQMVGGVLTSVICLVLLIMISPLLTLYVLVPVAVFGIISLKAFGKIRPIFRERGVINAEVTGRLTETLGGIRVIKGFNAEKQEIRTLGRREPLVFECQKQPYRDQLRDQCGDFALGLGLRRDYGNRGLYDHGAGFDLWRLFGVYFTAGFYDCPHSSDE